MRPTKNLYTFVLLAIVSISVISEQIFAISGQQPAKRSSGKVSDRNGAVQSKQFENLSLFLDAADYGQSISPYIYGEFIEHQGRCIYGGIWAEMIRDRKFYFPIDTFLFSDPNHKSPWRIVPIGKYIEMDTLNAFVGKHSPRIDLDGSSVLGIMQDSITIQKDSSYTGHIVLSGSGSLVVRVSLIWGPGPEGRQTLIIDGVTEEYSTISLQFTAGASTDIACLEILAEGTGTVYIGTVSLMPANNISGMRADVIDLLRQLGGTVYRWPGGWFGNGYIFTNAIGDRDKRAPWINGIYGTEQLESNDFGPDEFMTFVETIGTEPYIGASAMGSFDIQKAANEVEYFNGSSGTPMGQLRATNGHSEPYDVQFWGIGCETWGFSALNDYAALHNQIAQAMLAVDPSIKIVAVGGLGSYGGEPDQGEWTEGMLTQSAEYMDLMSEHLYAMSGNNLFDYSRSLAVMVDTFVAAHREFAQELPSLQDKNIRLVFDEWNYYWGDKPYLYGDGGVRQYFKDALGMATALHELLRNSDKIFMANTHPVNVLGHIKTNDTASAFEVTALPLILYRRNFGTVPLTVSAIYDSLNVVAALTADHEFLTVGIVNPTLHDRSITLDLDNAELTGAGKWWRISSTDSMAYNEPGQPPEVMIDSGTQAAISPVLEVPAWSITLYKLPIQIEEVSMDTSLLTFIKTVQVTPDTNFKSGGFARVGYVSATNDLVVTFGGAFTDTIDGLTGGYAYKEYTLDMQSTGISGALYEAGGDIGGLLVNDNFYAVNMVPVGWRIVKFDAISWMKLADITFPLDTAREMNGDMMVAFVNGQIDISSQCLLPGEFGPVPEGTGTHHQFFTPDLEFLEMRMFSDTPNICGSSMIYLEGIYYFVTANKYTGDVIMINYDSTWKYLGMEELINQGHWSEGVAFDGQRFYVAYLDTRLRTEPHFFPYYPNVHLAAFDTDWNLLADVAVTDYIPADSLFTGRPSLLLHENKIYVSYDVVPLPEDLSKIEAYVSVYEIPTSPPILIEQHERIREEFQLEQNYPNPFSSFTSIAFSLQSGQPVTLKIYDIQGREVGVLVDEILPPGTHTVTLDAKKLMNGIYLYKLITGNYTQTRKCIVSK